MLFSLLNNFLMGSNGIYFFKYFGKIRSIGYSDF